MDDPDTKVRQTGTPPTTHSLRKPAHAAIAKDIGGSRLSLDPPMGWVALA
tara:strand:+ start:1207 stop:1356 length:150 start_codon:yes stop_codon:yes gene_type:complete